MFQRKLKRLSNRFWTKTPVIRNIASVHTNIPSDDTLDKLRIPKFEFPWMSACSPYVDRIEEESFQWGLQHNLLPNDRYQERVKRSLLGHLTSRGYPQTNYTLLRTIGDYLVWTFVVDDLLDRVETLGPHYTIQNLTSIIDFLDYNRLGDNAFYGETALIEVCQRLRVQLSNEQFQRFVNGIRLFCCSTAFLILHQLQPQSVGIEPYETIRFYAGNMNPFLDLADIANGAMVPAKTFYRPEVQRLRRCTNNVILWTNDIYSLNKELQQPGQPLNMVTIYASQGNSLQQSIDYTAERIRDEINEFVRISRIIISEGEKGLTSYITGLQYWMGGHQDWLEYDTQRYSRTFAKEDADNRAQKLT